VPDGGAGSGVTKNILETAKCNGCHYEFAFHGGPRKSMEYCVTCHNPGTVDQDSGHSLDMAHMLHSVHMGEDRLFPDAADNPTVDPFIIWGFSDSDHDYSHVTYPQSKTYCETCHTATVAAPDGDNWNAAATAKTCGGCHANGLLAANFDAVTGQAEYQFDHSVSDVPALGAADDGSCGGCHLGNITTAGDALAIHSSIRGDDRARAEAGDNFVLQILDAANFGPGLIPTVRILVTDPDDVPYDILNDPEFDLANNASLNLYVQWSTNDYYGGDENGLVLGGRHNDPGDVPLIQAIQDLNFRDTGYPYRIRLGAIQAVATPNGAGDGSYNVPFYQALPADFTGDVVFGLGGHPAYQTTDQNGDVYWERAAAVSALYFPGAERVAAFDSAQCNACHNRLQMHGSNRNGNAEFCLMCHNGDAAVCDVNPLPDGSCPAGETMEGYGMALMIHSIHSASTTWLEGWAQGVHYPQDISGCDTCHKAGSYDVARTSARAVSTDHGADIRIWTDDIATTPNATACGACHDDVAAAAHFNSNGGQVDVAKSEILTVGGLPNGQEACAVCHGTGSEFATERYHEQGPL
jgi:OmcA/MtrC family decaheme c-type cytochrome